MRAKGVLPAVSYEPTGAAAYAASSAFLLEGVAKPRYEQPSGNAVYRAQQYAPDPYPAQHRQPRDVPALPPTPTRTAPQPQQQPAPEATDINSQTKSKRKARNKKIYVLNESTDRTLMTRMVNENGSHYRRWTVRA